MDLYTLLRPFFFSLPAETSHNLAILLLRLGLYPRLKLDMDPCLSVKLWDLDFPNPIGIAAGFDKNAQVSIPLMKMGFGFVEVGTLTPLPQSGNPLPRLFRLIEDQALINRFGFNNEGFEKAQEYLIKAQSDRYFSHDSANILGINLGANKNSEDRIFDYVNGVRQFAAFAGYLTINISSPNTPGLRQLQSFESLKPLLEGITKERDLQISNVGRRVPLLLKIAPDLSQEELIDLIKICTLYDLDGYIISNTTIERHDLISPFRNESGGLSGAPLFKQSTEMISFVRSHIGPSVPIIGVGGIFSGETASKKLQAGANLIQIYSGFVYKGPRLLYEICNYLQNKNNQGEY